MHHRRGSQRISTGIRGRSAAPGWQPFTLTGRNREGVFHRVRGPSRTAGRSSRYRCDQQGTRRTGGANLLRFNGTRDRRQRAAGHLQQTHLHPCPRRWVQPQKLSATSGRPVVIRGRGLGVPAHHRRGAPADRPAAEGWDPHGSENHPGANGKALGMREWLEGTQGPGTERGTWGCAEREYGATHDAGRCGVLDADHSSDEGPGACHNSNERPHWETGGKEGARPYKCVILTKGSRIGGRRSTVLWANNK